VGKANDLARPTTLSADKLGSIMTTALSKGPTKLGPSKQRAQLPKRSATVADPFPLAPRNFSSRRANKVHGSPGGSAVSAGLSNVNHSSPRSPKNNSREESSESTESRNGSGSGQRTIQKPSVGNLQRNQMMDIRASPTGPTAPHVPKFLARNSETDNEQHQKVEKLSQLV